MSRAFVRESDEGWEQLPPRPPLPAGVTNYITPAGAKRMEAELARLLEQKRSCASEEDRRNLEARIRDLQQRLQTLVVTPAPTSRNTVSFGASVKVRDSDGEQTTYRIVGIDEADAERDEISWRSPLARAILSHQVGDKVQFDAPAGARELEILEISYQPDELTA